MNKIKKISSSAMTTALFCTNLMAQVDSETLKVSSLEPPALSGADASALSHEEDATIPSEQLQEIIAALSLPRGEDIEIPVASANDIRLVPDAESDGIQGGVMRIAWPTVNQWGLYVGGVLGVLTTAIPAYFIPRKILTSQNGQSLDTVLCVGGTFSFTTLLGNGQLAAMGLAKREYDINDQLITFARIAVAPWLYLGCNYALYKAYAPESVDHIAEANRIYDKKVAVYNTTVANNGSTAGRNLLDTWDRQAIKADYYLDQAQVQRDKIRIEGRSLRIAQQERAFCKYTGVSAIPCYVMYDKRITAHHTHLRNLYKAMTEFSRAAAKQVNARAASIGVGVVSKGALPRSLRLQYIFDVNDY